MIGGGLLETRYTPSFESRIQIHELSKLNGLCQTCPETNNESHPFRERRSDSDPALPSSPSVLDNLDQFVRSKINSFILDDDFSPPSSPSSGSSTSTTSSLGRDLRADMERIEVMNALASFESIGSSVGSSDTTASTLSEGYYTDQPLSPLMEEEEEHRLTLISQYDDVFERAETVSSSSGGSSDREVSSDEEFASEVGKSVFVPMEEEAFVEVTREDAEENETAGNLTQMRCLNLAFSERSDEKEETSGEREITRVSSGSDTLENFEVVPREDLELESLPSLPNSSPASSGEESAVLIDGPYIVIKLIDFPVKSEYESVLPYGLDKLSEFRSKINNNRRRSSILDKVLVPPTTPPTTPVMSSEESPEEDPIVREMIASFKVEEILKVLDEEGPLDTSSLLNSEACMQYSPSPKPRLYSRVSFSDNQPAQIPQLYDGEFEIEPPQSPDLITKIDEMIESLKFEMEYSLCPCSAMKTCTIL